jgi:hypothetical protein
MKKNSINRNGRNTINRIDDDKIDFSDLSMTGRLGTFSNRMIYVGEMELCSAETGHKALIAVSNSPSC